MFSRRASMLELLRVGLHSPIFPSSVDMAVQLVVVPSCASCEEAATMCGLMRQVKKSGLELPELSGFPRLTGNLRNLVYGPPLHTPNDPTHTPSCRHTHHSPVMDSSLIQEFMSVDMGAGNPEVSSLQGGTNRA